MNTPRWAPAALAAAALITLAACGSAKPPPAVFSPAVTATAPASAPAAAPASPVPLLKQTGAVPEAGTAAGQHDVYGDRYAAGRIGSEQVTAYTAADAAAYQANLAAAWTPDDTQAVITVPARNSVVILTAYIGDGGPQWAPGGTPAEIAAKVGGTVVKA
jgi:hypothetical protein